MSKVANRIKVVDRQKRKRVVKKYRSSLFRDRQEEIIVMGGGETKEKKERLQLYIQRNKSIFQCRNVLPKKNNESIEKEYE